MMEGETMTKQEELIAYIKGLTPEQVDKICNRLPLLRQSLELNEWEAQYIQAFTHKMFLDDGEA